MRSHYSTYPDSHTGYRIQLSSNELESKNNVIMTKYEEIRDQLQQEVQKEYQESKYRPEKISYEQF